MSNNKQSKFHFFPKSLLLDFKTFDTDIISIEFNKLKSGNISQKLEDLFVLNIKDKKFNYKEEDILILRKSENYFNAIFEGNKVNSNISVSDILKMFRSSISIGKHYKDIYDNKIGTFSKEYTNRVNEKLMKFKEINSISFQKALILFAERLNIYIDLISEKIDFQYFINFLENDILEDNSGLKNNFKLMNNFEFLIKDLNSEQKNYFNSHIISPIWMEKFKEKNFLIVWLKNNNSITQIVLYNIRVFKNSKIARKNFIDSWWKNNMIGKTNFRYDWNQLNNSISILRNIKVEYTKLYFDKQEFNNIITNVISDPAYEIPGIVDSFFKYSFNNFNSLKNLLNHKEKNLKKIIKFYNDNKTSGVNINELINAFGAKDNIVRKILIWIFILDENLHK